MNFTAVIEAALFSAESSLTVKEIAEKTKLSEEDVDNGLGILIKDYDKRGSAIQILKTGNTYKMALRPEYTDVAGGFSKVELTNGQQRTLITIAYNQPVMQSELFRNLGARVYDDVPSLADMGFITRKHVGQSLELTTTKYFAEYFGIGSTKKEDIRAWIDRNRKKSE